MAEIKLKKCPACNSKARSTQINFFPAVRCSNENCYMYYCGPKAVSKEQATRIWNEMTQLVAEKYLKGAFVSIAAGYAEQEIGTRPAFKDQQIPIVKNYIKLLQYELDWISNYKEDEANGLHDD